MTTAASVAPSSAAGPTMSQSTFTGRLGLHQGSSSLSADTAAMARTSHVEDSSEDKDSSEPSTAACSANPIRSCEAHAATLRSAAEFSSSCRWCSSATAAASRSSWRRPGRARGGMTPARPPTVRQGEQGRGPGPGPGRTFDERRRVRVSLAVPAGLDRTQPRRTAPGQLRGGEVIQR